MEQTIRPKGYDPDLIPPDDANRANWETFCSEIGRLLKEGYLGHLAYLRGGRIIAIYRNFHHYVESTKHEHSSEENEPALIQPILWELPRDIVINRNSYMPPSKSISIENEAA